MLDVHHPTPSPLPAASSILFKGNRSRSGSATEPSALRRLLASEQPQLRKLLAGVGGADSADDTASSPSTDLRKLQAAPSPASSRCCTFTSLHWTSHKSTVTRPPSKLTSKYKQASCSCPNAMAAAPKPPPPKPKPKPSPPPPACNTTGDRPAPALAHIHPPAPLSVGMLDSELPAHVDVECCPCDTAERTQLLQVKASLDPQNKRLATWTDKSCPCSGTWTGVTCANGAVVSV